MSYCVNCGVELDDSAKKCALCSTPVINPNKTDLQNVTPPFSEEEHIPKEVKTRITALAISMVLLVPNIVCFLINAVTFSGSFWSLYVNATSLLLWVIFIFPFITKKLHPYVMWGFDTVSVALYVLFFFKVGDETANWYFKAALPIIIAASLLIVIYMLWVRKKKRHWLLKTIHICCDIGIAGLVTGLILSVEIGLAYASFIGLTVFICFLSIVLFLIYCYSSKTLRKWFSKRFFA
ncbi:MAG: hypothetical protein IJ491_05205 [Clostridia bacterium]|nr:hypothetical protein [Clostridia bacterium]